MTAHRLQGHLVYQGIPLAIENQKGSVRQGVDSDGKKWRTVMKVPYGYIKGTSGADGEEVDVFVGPSKHAPNAFVVHQRKADGTGYDEDKVIFGVKDEAAARKLYLAHYNDPKFLGPISEVPMEKLKGLVEEGKQMKKISMDAFFSELAKVGAISDEQARGSLERLDTLERNKPTMGQVGRYAGLGAVTAPAMGMIGNAIRSGGRALVEGGTVKDKLRNVAADAAKGAVGMGAMPLLRSHLDRRAEIGTLKNYMQQPHELPSASPGPPGTEVMGKVGAVKDVPQKPQHEQPGWGQAGAGMVGGAALGLTNIGLGSHLMKQVGGHPEDADLFNKVRGNANVPIHETSPGMPSFIAPQWNNPEAHQGILAAKGIPDARIGPEGAVLLPKGGGSPSILGHELGHADIHSSRAGRALQNGTTLRLGLSSSGIGTLAGGLSGMSDNRNVQRLGLAAPALAALPELAYEGLASYNAIKRLRGAGATSAQMGRAAKTLIPAWGTYATRAGMGVAHAAMAQGAVSGIRHAGDHEKTAFSPMSEIKLMGKGVRKAAVGARDFLAQPMRGLPSTLGSPAGTRKAALEGGGFMNMHVPAKPPNMRKLQGPSKKEEGFLMRSGELMTGSRLKALREGEQYWGGRAQQELGQAPSVINGMLDPTVSADQLRGLGRGLQSAKDKASPMQMRADAFGGQVGSEANKVVASRLGYGAGVGGYLGLLGYGANEAHKEEEKAKRRTVR